MDGEIGPSHPETQSLTLSGCLLGGLYVLVVELLISGSVLVVVGALLHLALSLL